MSKKKNNKKPQQNISAKTTATTETKGRGGFYGIIDKIIIILYLGVGFIQLKSFFI